MSRKRSEPQRIVHEQKKYSPTWTLISVGFVAVAVWAAGRWLRDMDQANNFATVLVFTVGFTIRYWAKRRPDRLRRRLGALGAAGAGIQESIEAVEKLVYRQPLAVAVPIAVVYGCAFVAAKEVVRLALTSLFSWTLVVALAAAVGAVVARPQLYSSLKAWLSPDEDESEDDGPRAGENPYEPGRDGDPSGDPGMEEES